MRQQLKDIGWLALAGIVLGMAGEVGWPHWVLTLAGLIGKAYGTFSNCLGVGYRSTR